MNRLIFGCGYFGLRVARKWIAAGDPVFATTRSHDRAELFRREGIEPVIADVTDVSSLKSLPEVETVLYAVSYDRHSGASRRAVYVDGIANAVDAMHGRFQRWISISSTSVYGQDRGEWVDENSPCEPVAENGRIVLEAENVLRDRFASAGSDARTIQILRLAGIYGPGRLLRRIESLRKGDPIEGRGDAWLNLIHVDDAADVVVACADGLHASGVTLVSDDEPVARRDYYSLLAELANAPPPRFAIESSPRDGEIGLNKRCSNRKLRADWRVPLEFPTFRLGLPHAITN
ncbi:MAG: NAD-dependent epimerase/dehydratase family protein [Planctomycetaceae bacterium]